MEAFRKTYRGIRSDNVCIQTMTRQSGFTLVSMSLTARVTRHVERSVPSVSLCECTQFRRCMGFPLDDLSFCGFVASLQCPSSSGKEGVSPFHLDVPAGSS